MHGKRLVGEMLNKIPECEMPVSSLTFSKASRNRTKVCNIYIVDAGHTIRFLVWSRIFIFLNSTVCSLQAQWPLAYPWGCRERESNCLLMCPLEQSSSAPSTCLPLLPFLILAALQTDTSPLLKLSQGPLSPACSRPGKSFTPWGPLQKAMLPLCSLGQILPPHQSARFGIGSLG